MTNVIQQERSMKSVIPDVANHQTPAYSKTLDKVGMSAIEIPIRLETPEGIMSTHGKARAFVSLDDPDTKGIHMSRLYVSTQTRFEEELLTGSLIKKVLDDFLVSHKDLSQKAYLDVEFELITKRKALLSDNEGWRTYPVKIRAEKSLRGDYACKIDLQIAYSSTCPCSAALARQLIQDKFSTDYAESDSFSKQEILQWLGKETSIMATPHGQRSHANVTFIPESSSIDQQLPLIPMINTLESSIKTPVQTAVKRIDEQEFARRNGENLMFAEDAARNLAESLDGIKEVLDYRVEVIHYESLHNHDAYAMASKGIEGGL